MTNDECLKKHEGRNPNDEGRQGTFELRASDFMRHSVISHLDIRHSPLRWASKSLRHPAPRIDLQCADIPTYFLNHFKLRLISSSRWTEW